jgi:hypothetical protein
MSNSRNRPPNTDNYISDLNTLLFASLINMYNDNIRSIRELQSTNNEIRNTLVELANSQERTSRTTSQTTSRRRTSNRNNISHREDERIFINGLPYIVDNIQITDNYGTTIPFTNTNNNETRLNNTVNNLFESFFDPIPILPTENQIESATRVVRFGDIINPLNQSCCISLEPFLDDTSVVMIRYCRHLFSRNAIRGWFEHNSRCPICRYDIRNWNINQNLSTTSVDLSNNSIRRNRTQTYIPSMTQDENEQNQLPNLHRRNLDRSINNNNRNTRTFRNSINNLTSELTNPITELILNNLDQTTNLLDTSLNQIDNSGNLTDPSNNQIISSLVFNYSFPSPLRNRNNTNNINSNNSNNSNIDSNSETDL